MKKILYLLLLLFAGLPMFAVCSITGGACSAPVNFEASSLKDRLVPNNLQQLKRTDYFQPQIVAPYGMNVNIHSEATGQDSESDNFNTECQFGECLPTQNNGEN